MAASGLGSGDETRTVAYSPAALRTLLVEAGFDEIDVEASPNGKNSVAKARRSPEDRVAAPASSGDLHAALAGDMQLSAALCNGGDRVECELAGPNRNTTLAFDLPSAAIAGDGSRVSICARATPLAPQGTELQLWLWRGLKLVASECFRFEFAASEMQLRCSGDIEHLSVWSPADLSIESTGNAYVPLGDLPPGVELSEAERGAEGRLLVIEPPEEAAMRRNSSAQVAIGS